MAGPDTKQRTLYYVHDPMCSWCWAFRPVWSRIRERAPEDLLLRRVLGGLAPDSDEPMSQEMQHYLQGVWRTIQQRVPGTRFDFSFWEHCQPRRATYPACRAVIAARSQSPASEEPMILAIQQAYYLQARNPSDNTVLTALAVGIGLDAEQFAQALDASETQLRLEEEMAFGRTIGVQGFPSLVLEQAGQYRLLNHDYNDAQVVLEQLV
ncbi:MAG: DsbA family protein [Gammaproteobacteria bacterium]|nr:DsbA family protein [Gammaproteobacteria bacterium]MCP5417278.1 DsbA family protein [Chromatiaceae bacterium]